MEDARAGMSRFVELRCFSRRASERARLVASGKTLSFVDGQIAAIARVHALVFVTANVRHYEGFEGLTIADWRSR